MVGCARVVFRAVRLICSMPDCLGLFVVGGAHRLSSFAMTPQLRVKEQACSTSVSFGFFAEWFV